MIKFNENKIEQSKELIIKIIDQTSNYFDNNLNLLNIDSSTPDELLPRRFAVYLIREKFNIQMTELAEIFETTFKGVYLDHSYIHEKVVIQDTKFTDILKELDSLIFESKPAQQVDEIEKLDEPKESLEEVIDFNEQPPIKFENTNREISINDSQIQTLIDRAISASKNAYTPYSHYNVGAALLTKDNKIYDGANIENASYGLSLCAERVTIFGAVKNGDKNFKAIAIVVQNENTGIPEYPIPCGACLQVMSEFCKGDFVIILAKSNTDYIIKTLDDIMPMRFKLKDD